MLAPLVALFGLISPGASPAPAPEPALAESRTDVAEQEPAAAPSEAAPEDDAPGDPVVPAPADPDPNATTPDPGDSPDPSDSTDSPGGDKDPAESGDLDDPFAGMLEGEGDDPGRSPARRTGAASPAETGVDRAEALRRYYRALYRPASNPARPYFGVHGGGGLLGSSKSELNGRFGFFDAEAGVSWNRFGLAAGGGIAGGDILLDGDGDAIAPFGVTGQLNLGLGRLAYLTRGVLDLRVGYRLNWFKVRANEDAAPDLQVGSMVLHGPDLRVDMGFMVSRVREPRFFHRVGVSIGGHLVVHTIGVSQPVFFSPRFGLFYAFG